MAFDLDELTDHDGTKDCPICRAQAVVEGALVPAVVAWETHHELPHFSLALHGAAGELLSKVGDGGFRRRVRLACLRP